MAYGQLSSLLMGAPQSLGPVPPGGLRGGSLAQLLQPGLPMGSGALPGQFPEAPGAFTPEPFDLFSPENALPIAGALISGPSSAEAIGGALGKFGELYGANAGRNKALKELSSIDPEMAKFAAAGAPLDKLWAATLKKKGMGDDVNYSTPTLMTRKDGSQGYVMFGNDGSMKELSAGDLKPGKVSYRDHGTYTAVLDSAGNEIGQIPKDNFGAAYDTQSGKNQADTENEKRAKKPKALATLSSLDLQQSTVKGKIQEALAMIKANPGLVTGLGGDLTKAIAGSPAYNLARTLDSIKANVGFDKLQEMRDNSPTGGALGQVTEQELALLQSVFGSLAQGQSDEQIAQNLVQLQSIIERMAQIRREAFRNDYGEDAPASQPIPGVTPDAPKPKPDDPFGIRK